jgi:hypothetical protein
VFISSLLYNKLWTFRFSPTTLCTATRSSA